MFIYTGVYFTRELLTLYTNMTAGDSAASGYQYTSWDILYDTLKNSFYSLPV